MHEHETENKKIEKRFIDTTLQIEKRELNKETGNGKEIKEQRILKGYAIKYNSLSEDLGGFKERILKGALTKTLEKSEDVRCLWGHNTMYVLGRESAGTLKLKEDNTGLYFEVEVPNTNWANDLVASVERGDINQMSFGFIPVEENFTYEREIDTYILDVNELRLFEISLVTFPAYTETSVRNRESALMSFRESQNKTDDKNINERNNTTENTEECIKEREYFDNKLKILELENKN